jgi:hypothetical protein
LAEEDLVDMDGRRERVGVIANSFASDIGVVGSEERSSNFSASRCFSSESILFAEESRFSRSILWSST